MILHHIDIRHTDVYPYLLQVLSGLQDSSETERTSADQRVKCQSCKRYIISSIKTSILSFYIY